MESAIAPQLPPMAVLAKKMSGIMGKLQRIGKNGTNKDQGWQFSTVDDITDAIRALMSEFGIALFSRMVKSNEVKEGKITRATVDMEFELVCTDTGYSKVMTWTGSADDHSDKALNKAAVYAEKFWLKSTFLVSSGKDPDAGSPGQSRRDQRPQQPQRPPQQAARQVDPNTGEVLNQAPAPVVDAPAVKMASCLKTSRECQQQFRALCDELGVASDAPYINALGLKERYSEYPGTFDALCSEMRKIHADIQAQEANSAPSLVDQAAATISPAQAAASLGSGGERRIGNPAAPATSNGGSGATTGATSASPSSDNPPVAAGYVQPPF